MNWINPVLDIGKKLLTKMGQKREIEVDAKTATVEYAKCRGDANTTQLVGVEVKLNFLNNTGKDVFIKFSSPILRHTFKLAFELRCMSYDLLKSYKISSTDSTEFVFTFKIIGGYIEVVDFSPKSLMFEITYHKKQRIEKVFIDKDVSTMTKFNLEPLGPPPPRYFPTGLQYLLENRTNEAYDQFEKSGFSDEEIGILLAENGEVCYYNTEYKKGITLLLAAKMYFEKCNFPSVHFNWARLYSSLATTYCYDQDYTQAIPHFEKALSIMAQLPDFEHHIEELKQRREKCMKGSQ